MRTLPQQLFSDTNILVVKFQQGFLRSAQTRRAVGDLDTCTAMEGSSYKESNTGPALAV